jgi:hypothetical protein
MKNEKQFVRALLFHCCLLLSYNLCVALAIPSFGQLGGGGSHFRPVFFAAYPKPCYRSVIYFITK